MRLSANNGFTNATDAADYLVKHGVPFRDAHGIIGKIVLYCIERGIAIDDMSLDELKAICPVFEEDIYEEISMETCVNNRLTIGAPGKAAMEKVIEAEKGISGRGLEKGNFNTVKRYCKNAQRIPGKMTFFYK